MGRYLYIGSSSSYMKRVINHRVLNKVDKYLEDDEIHFWKVPKENRVVFENHLIEVFNPVYQHYGNVMRTRWWKNTNINQWKPK